MYKVFKAAKMIAGIEKTNKIKLIVLWSSPVMLVTQRKSVIKDRVTPSIATFLIFIFRFIRLKIVGLIAHNSRINAILRYQQISNVFIIKKLVLYILDCLQRQCNLIFFKLCAIVLAVNKT